MYFDYFVVPFCLGFAFLCIQLIIKYGRWMSELGEGSGKKIVQSLLTRKSVNAVREVFMECLVHKKIFKVNPLLGYMHMSLALGWFLLIVIGKLESLYFTGDVVNEFYYPIFFRFFELHPHNTTVLAIFNGLMDLLLLVILSGVFLALIKRYKSGVMGMKNSTKHTPGDRWALAMLWLVFPLRLLAESLTAGFAGNGSFLTQPLGNMLAMFLPAKDMAYPFWWAYSVVLGGFLVALPFSRYMHIPTEIFLIFLKNWGFKPETTATGLVAFEIFSCSRCGICIDPCQMDPSVNRNDRMVYFLRDLRAGKPVNEMAQNCLLCGRCQEICPVGIDLTNLRLIARKQDKYLPIKTSSHPIIPLPSKVTDVIYFSGCMGSLTPGVRKSMELIFNESGINYFFLDKEKSYCCGRPLKLAGRLEEAKCVSQNIADAIHSSGASTLVTSCPICYKSFREDYNFKVRILHHSEYLLELVQYGLIKFQTQNHSKRIVYHDPCELGRKSGIYSQPRKLLSHLGSLIPIGESHQKSLCCGGSPGNLSLSMAEREAVQQSTAAYLNKDNPDYIATACPLCKKSLSKFSEHTVIDVAELVSRNMISHGQLPKLAIKPNLAEILAD